MHVSMTYELIHAGPYYHYQYLKGNYANSLFFANSVNACRTLQSLSISKR